MPKIRFSSDQHAYRITLDDPPLHILDLAMLEELREALARVDSDRHTLIIDATGEKAFSAGANVQDHRRDRVATMLGRFHDCFRTLGKLDAVTIALVQGVALGGGCELALACDFVLASEKSRFGFPEIGLGVFPPVGAWQMSRQLAPRRGLELLITGDAIDARAAMSLGLVNDVYADDEFETRSAAWLERLYRHSASSVRIAKKAYRLAGAADFDKRLSEIEQLYLHELMETEDAIEGIEAFVEKRKPAWKDR